VVYHVKILTVKLYHPFKLLQLQNEALFCSALFHSDAYFLDGRNGVSSWTDFGVQFNRFSLHSIDGDNSTVHRLELGGLNITSKELEHLFDRFKCSIADVFQD